MRKWLMVLWVFWLAGCTMPRAPMPSGTLPPALARTPQAAAAAAQATISAAEAEKVRVEAAMAAAKATQRAAEATQQAEWNAQATQRALQATATMQAAQSTAIAMAAQATGTALAQELSVRGTSTAMALHATGTVAVAEAEAARTRAEASARMSMAWALLSWLAVVGSMVLLLWGFFGVFRAWAHTRVVPRDTHGDAPLLVLPGGDVVDADRNPWPVLPVHGGHANPIPIETQAQLAVTERDQMLALARHAGAHGSEVLPLSHSPRGQPIREPSGGLPKTLVRILPPEQVPWLDEVEHKALGGSEA